MSEKIRHSTQRLRRKVLTEATYADVSRALSKHTEKVLDQIPCDRLQLSLPTDGKGARIRVSVMPEDVEKVPDFVELTFRRRKVAIPLEASDDYERVKAQ